MPYRYENCRILGIIVHEFLNELTSNYGGVSPLTPYALLPHFTREQLHRVFAIDLLNERVIEKAAGIGAFRFGIG